MNFLVDDEVYKWFTSYKCSYNSRGIDGAGVRRSAVVTERASHTARALQEAGVEVGVTSGVLHQVVTAHEAFLAQRAAEPLLAGVCAVVAGQLVGPGKPLTAFGPCAGEWSLT